MKAMWLDTPSFDATTNFKEFFLKNDALCNVESELVFSIFDRYMCKAGCQMCYIKDDWIEDEDFPSFVPKQITPDIEDKLLFLFDFFDIVSTTDDLFLLKHHYPELFAFYVKNSHLLYSTAMTDIAFIQQYNIVMKEMNFRGIYEISFSDRFLMLNEGKMIDVVLDKLSILHDKCPIQKVKIILCDAAESMAEENLGVKKLIEWCDSSQIYTDVHDDITQGRNLKYNLKKAKHQVTNILQDNKKSFIYQILSEVVYVQNTSFFLALSQTVDKDSEPFDTIQSFDPVAFLPAVINAKLRTYADYIQRMSVWCDRTTNSKYLDYFKYLVGSIVVNNNYTFIPKIILKPYSRFYTKLIDYGFKDTPLGLLKNGCSDVIPIVSVTKKPKIKIEHIPIVTAK